MEYFLNTVNVKRIMMLTLVLALVATFLLLGVEDASADSFFCQGCTYSGEMGRYWFR